MKYVFDLLGVIYASQRHVLDLLGGDISAGGDIRQSAECFYCKIARQLEASAERLTLRYTSAASSPDVHDRKRCVVGADRTSGAFERLKLVGVI